MILRTVNVTRHITPFREGGSMALVAESWSYSTSL